MTTLRPLIGRSLFKIAHSVKKATTALGLIGVCF
jgi:hypothetical protein